MSKSVIIFNSSPVFTSWLYALQKLVINVVFTILSLILNYPSFKLTVAVYKGLSIGHPLPYIFYDPYIPI